MHRNLRTFATSLKLYKVDQLEKNIILNILRLVESNVRQARDR